MLSGIWKRIQEEFAILRVGLLPGILLITLLIIIRLTGLMQFSEWLAFDTFLSLGANEPVDQRIVIVGINEDDIQNAGTYPIPDQEIAKLLFKLQSYSPRVIGLDIFKDLPVNPGHNQLVAAFEKIKNLIAIEKVLPEKVKPPPELPTQQVCFADQIIDADGKLRRSLLKIKLDQVSKLSLTTCLAKAYLADQGINFDDHHDSIKFGETELPQLPNSMGVEILLNFRHATQPFRILSLNDINTGNFRPEWIRDRIIIVGINAPSVKDFITTSATRSTKAATGRVYGVEIQAHAVSQIISAVLDGRILLHTLSIRWEYTWIFGWGILGIIFARITQSPCKNILILIFASFILVGVSYELLILGWWVPLVPALLILILNGLGLATLYQYEQALRLNINARQTVIESTFVTIHNGPLQTLARVIKRVRERNLPTDDLLIELDKLNYELRGIYEFLQQEPLTQNNSLYLGSGVLLNLQDPIHEILYQIYSYTLERDFPCFETLKIKIRTFDPIEDKHLTIEQKLGLCRFLEEALCNVGKHAQGVTRLEVTCQRDGKWNILKVIDDGLGINYSHEGRGTQQSKDFAKIIHGKFRRLPLSPRGTLCELSWRVSKFF